MSYTPEYLRALMREVWLAGWTKALATVQQGKSLDELLERAEEYCQSGIGAIKQSQIASSYNRGETIGKCRCGEPGKLMLTTDSEKGYICHDCLTAMREAL